MSGLYVDYAVLILKFAFDQQKFAASDDQAVSIIEVGCNDHIGNARLVFHRDENESLRGTRTLSSDNTIRVTIVRRSLRIFPVKPSIPERLSKHGESQSCQGSEDVIEQGFSVQTAKEWPVETTPTPRSLRQASLLKYPQ